MKVERVGVEKLILTFPTAEDRNGDHYDVLAYADVLERDDEAGAAPEQLVMVLKDSQRDAIRKDIVAQAIDTVRGRVDIMGVAEPSIYPKNDQIVVELPGLSDTASELRAATTEAANKLATLLRVDGIEAVEVSDVREDPGAFYLTIRGTDARAHLTKILGDRVQEGGRIVDPQIGPALELAAATAADDSERVKLALAADARDKVLEESSDFRRLLRAIERAAVLEMHLIDDETPFGDTGVPYLRALYENGLVYKGLGIAVNLEEDYGRPEKGGVLVKEPFAFYAKERETLQQFFDNLPAKWRLPSTHAVAYGTTPIVTRRGQPPELIWRTYIIRARADITGDRIVNANVSFKQDTGTPQVDVKFDRQGAAAFETMSGDNVGRKMAIVMDNNVVSDPVFNERIAGGSVVITMGAQPGESVRDQANDLAKVLKSGSLPARLEKEFEMRVGAELGREAVDSGFRSFVLGLGLVALFMAIYYRRAGVVAVLALVLNFTLMLAGMAFFRATLTLPGIAGLVLTLGMAVDANVIVYERIREHLRDGYTARAAIEAGYDRAFSTILDSQLTTAIAGLVLWQYGSGPIRGFAVTLLIGIATSVFTAVFATRVFFDWQANRSGYDKVSI